MFNFLRQIQPLLTNVKLSFKLCPFNGYYSNEHAAQVQLDNLCLALDYLLPFIDGIRSINCNHSLCLPELQEYFPDVFEHTKVLNLNAIYTVCTKIIEI